MRDIGLDVETSPEALELFAQSLGSDDRVALEVAGNAWEIARIIEPHVAHGLARGPLAAGRVNAGNAPAARASQPAGQGAHAREERDPPALIRRLVPKPKVSDLFGSAGRRWLAELELPPDERETVASCLRQIDFLDGELQELEAVIARSALESADARRLMTVPGVNVITAASFLAAIGDVRRFRSPRKLTGYLGLDPRVRQSGAGPASHGRISKQGSAPARYALVEASWSVVRQPGPLHAFYERIRARRGHQVAIVAAARKLACLFWQLLTKQQDYAYAQPSLTNKKLRRLELLAGAPKGKVKPGIWSANKALREAEREFAQQAEAA